MACVSIAIALLVWLIPAKEISIVTAAPTGIWEQFSAKNRRAGWEILMCESRLQNICVPDSDGIPSCGIAQIHLDGTWGDLTRKSGIRGDYMDPPTAAKMLNWAIDHPTELRRWTCASILGHVK